MMILPNQKLKRGGALYYDWTLSSRIVLFVVLIVIVSNSSVTAATPRGNQNLRRGTENNNDNDKLISNNRGIKRDDITSSDAVSSSLQSHPLPSKPVVIYTFFSEVDDHFSGGTSYSDEMLEIWKSSWSVMGWEPRVLTLEDAMKHPLYETYNEELLAKVQLDPHPFPNDGLIRNNKPIAMYNRLCYLRWLAMAAVGGGWMADYDTLPLASPNEGDEIYPTQLTLHNFGVPSLVSGSADEWERIAIALLEEGKRTPSTDFTSDMVSLMHLIDYQNQGDLSQNLILQNEVIPSNRVLHLIVDEQNEDDYHKRRDNDITKSKNNAVFQMTKEQCFVTQTKQRAVHFSHRSLYDMIYQYPNFPYTVLQRPNIMNEWFHVFYQTCLLE